MNAFEKRLARHAEAVNEALSAMLERHRGGVPERLWEAMRYSLLAGGKRIRPILMRECFEACGGEGDIMPAMLGVECLHTYSLIHDDLPCMDDDDLRRGQPTCHKRFDEATAVLAGDALQALAFELTLETQAPDALRTELARRLAAAAGARGMVGGQMLDMEAGGLSANGPANDDSGMDVLAIERIHVHKTGALIRYCCEAGAVLAGAGADEVEACARYGKAVGLLFQIADDILDATASSETLGKSAGKDAAQHKATYVSLLGLDGARETAREMRDLALEALATLGGPGSGRAGALARLADFILERRA